MQPEQTPPDVEQTWQPPEAPNDNSNYQSEPVAGSDEPTAVALDQLPNVPSEEREGDEELVRWQESEYIHREKDSTWYFIFAAVVVVFMLIAIFLIKSWTFAVLVPVMAVALVVYSRRPPGVLDYTLSRKGLHINDRLYAFTDFKEFGLIRDDDQNSVLLVPRKRFMPGVTIYFPEEAGEAIIDMLAARLPMHEIHLDPIDRLIRLLRI